MKKRCVFAAGGLALLLMCPRPAAAADESTPCIVETTDQPIVYGAVLSGTECQISPAGDVDVFRFTGSIGEVVRGVALDRTGGGSNPAVCVDLLDPDTQPVFPRSCGNTSVEFNETLTKTGIYTILVSEAGNDASFPYDLSLERVTPARPDSPPLDFGAVVNDEINPPADLDAYRLNGTMGDILTLVVVDLTGGGSNPAVCLELLAPDGSAVVPRACGNTSVELTPIQLTVTGVYTVLVSEAGHDAAFAYNLSLTCLAGTCGPQLPVCEVALSAADGALDIDFTLRTVSPATWNVWFSVMNTTFRLWSVGPFSVDPATQVPISVPNFPSLGTVGFLTTLTTPDKGIICSDWETVDTGDPIPGGAMPTAERLRTLIPYRR